MRRRDAPPYQGRPRYTGHQRRPIQDVRLWLSNVSDTSIVPVVFAWFGGGRRWQNGTQGAAEVSGGSRPTRSTKELRRKHFPYLVCRSAVARKPWSVSWASLAFAQWLDVDRWYPAFQIPRRSGSLWGQDITRQPEVGVRFTPREWLRESASFLRQRKSGPKAKFSHRSSSFSLAPTQPSTGNDIRMLTSLSVHPPVTLPSSSEA